MLQIKQIHKNKITSSSGVVFNICNCFFVFFSRVDQDGMGGGIIVIANILLQNMDYDYYYI